jgi:hypothetical protein
MNTRLLAVALMAMSVSACEQANRLEETLTGKPALVAEPAPLLAIPEPVVEPVSPPAEVVAKAPAPVVEPVLPAEPECVSIFRVQTCEDGVLHMLGSNGEWLN